MQNKKALLHFVSSFLPYSIVKEESSELKQLSFFAVFSSPV